ncbi:toll-like receptor 4 [Saccostrea cucullata]|uniref:toll-like receptor 4 n=1 Tax=Saccostrea cuccullata TaxID=36930 RepID=UPI002ED4D486
MWGEVNFLVTYAYFVILRGTRSTPCTEDPKGSCIDLLGGLKADCSGKGLIVLPKFSQKVTQIDASHNNITNCPNLTYLQSLTYLDLSYNDLTNFKNNSFDNLTMLRMLNISNNKFRLNDETFPPLVFEPLTNLKVLSMKVKDPSDQNNEIYPKSLSLLTELRQLSINGLPNGRFGRKFSQLRKLFYLDISGNNGGHCQVETIDKDYFTNLKHLRTLDMTHCGIKSLQENAFSGLSDLKELDLSYNKEFTFRNLKNLTFDLQFTSINILKIKQIHCIFGMGTKVTWDDVWYIQNTSLTELYLDSNKIELLEANVTWIFRRLKVLSIADNRLTQGIYVFQFSAMRNLIWLNVSQAFSSHDLIGGNFITDLKCKDDLSSSVNHHTITKRSVGFVQSSLKRRKENSQFPLVLPLPPNLEIMYLVHSSLGYDVPKVIFLENSLQSLSLQGNQLSNLTGPIIGLTKLKILNLSKNNCKYISDYFFDFLNTIETLHLAKNKLSNSLARDIDGRTFRNLTNLKHLDLSNNEVVLLSKNVFQSLSNISNLDLSFNSIDNLVIKFSHMKGLKVLNLTNNRLSSLSETTRRTFDEITNVRNYPITLDLRNNPLLCNCDTKASIKWMFQQQKKNINFISFETLNCSTEDERIFSFKDRKILIELDIRCGPYSELAAGIGVLITVVLVLLISRIAYRYRWKIRYFYYATKSKFHGYKSLKNHSMYKYDAFISHADEDRDFVIKKMLPKLETDRNLKLCLHFRDFVPGYDIAENISTAINQSRYTVFVLSPEFVKSYWCMFELRMAQMESFYERAGEEMLFVVLYKVLPHPEIPLHLRELVYKKSYIEYPKDDPEKQDFWSNIHFTLKRSGEIVASI